VERSGTSSLLHRDRVKRQSQLYLRFVIEVLVRELVVCYDGSQEFDESERASVIIFLLVLSD
jgi:hypothetical protein